MCLESGIYFIRAVNRDGDELAVQYGGRGTRLFVAKSKDVPAQKWIISGDHTDGTQLQSIAPVPAPNFYVAPNGGSLDFIETPYRWCVSVDDGVYTIQEGDQHKFWSLDKAEAGKHPVLRKIEDAKHWSWTLVKART